VVTPDDKGRTVAILGQFCDEEAVCRAAGAADVVVAEAWKGDDAVLADLRIMSARAAARLASQLGSEVLYFWSRGYIHDGIVRDVSVSEAAEMCEEAQEVLPAASIVAPRDLDLTVLGDTKLIETS
jgi:hypothetical protein